jgi:hypothetical protein
MTRTTLKNVNKAIAKHSVEMVKGHGYFYFMALETVPLDLVLPEIDSVYTMFMNDLTLEEWVQHVEDFFQ